MATTYSVTFECCICNEATITDEDGLCATVSCGHVFHHNCLKNWQKTGHKTCPVCRIVYSRTLSLFGENRVVNPELDEKESQAFRTLKEDHKRLCTKYADSLRDFNSESGRCDQLERKVSELQVNGEIMQKNGEKLKKKLKDSEAAEAATKKSLNEALFKLSMYHELFGPECAIHFDQVMYNDTINLPNNGLGNGTLGLGDMSISSDGVNNDIDDQVAQQNLLRIMDDDDSD